MTDGLDLDALRRTAEAATPGFVQPDETDAWVTEERLRQRFIAAANPVTVIALLDRVRVAETERDDAQNHIAYHLSDFRPLGDMEATGDLAVDMAAWASRMRAERDRLAGAHDELDRLRAAIGKLADQYALLTGDSRPDISRERSNIVRSLRALLSAPATKGNAT